MQCSSDTNCFIAMYLKKWGFTEEVRNDREAGPSHLEVSIGSHSLSPTPLLSGKAAAASQSWSGLQVTKDSRGSLSGTDHSGHNGRNQLLRSRLQSRSCDIM